MKKTFTTLFAIMGLSPIFAQVLYSENFNSGSLPQGWVVATTGNRNWSVVSNVGSGWPDITHDGGFAFFDDDAAGSTGVNVATLTSPTINLTNDENIGLSFDLINLQYMYDSTVKVEVYDGAAWHQVYFTDENQYVGDSEPLGFVSIGPLDVSAYVNPNFKIKVTYDDLTDWSYGAALDNIVIQKINNYDVKIESVNLDKYILDGEHSIVSVVRNLGLPATSLTLNWNDGTIDHSSVIPVNIGTGETVEITHPIAFAPVEVGSYSINITATQINGQADVNPSDNSIVKTGAVLSQDAGTKVLIEEGTGTWCGWCPRGAVAMAYMEENYHDKFVGIAVHNNDPMEVEEYDTAAAFTGFPGMNVGRDALDVGVTQESMVNFVTTRSTALNPVKITANATFNGTDLSIVANAKFYSNFENSNYKLAVVITEDHVTGTNSGYRQYNYYSGGASGAMGGYESLPNPVPAAQMEYNHVGRALLGGYNGQEGSIPAVITDQMETNYTFNYSVPSTSNFANLNAVVLVLDGSDSNKVVNVDSFKISDLAVYQTVAKGFEMYPNPAKDVVNLTLEKAGKYNVEIFSLNGQAVLKQTLNAGNGETVQVPVSKLTKGVYLISIEGEKQSFSKKLVIK